MRTQLLGGKTIISPNGKQFAPNKKRFVRSL